MNFKLIFLFVFILIVSNCSAADINESNWLIEFNSRDLGKVNFTLKFDTQNNDFNAYSRKNADVDLLGFWKARIARLFGSNLKKGSFVRISGQFETINDHSILKGIFYSPAGTYHFNGSINDSSLVAWLQNRDLDTIGKIYGKQLKATYPLFNYVALVDSIIHFTENKIFDPSLMHSKDWNKFKSRILKTGQKAQDDIDFLFAFFYRSGDLPFSHYYIYQTTEMTFANSNQDISEPFEFKSINDTIALLKIHSFTFTPDSIHKLFKDSITDYYPYLVIDLQGNGGGNLTGLALVENITDTAFFGGVFLNNNWFSENKLPADPSDYDQFPVYSAYDLDSFFNLMHKNKGIVLKSNPVSNPYTGKIYVITDRYTASTCEPIVYHLKHNNLANIIGKNTAGAMLSAENFNMTQNWNIFIPTADYYTVDGLRLEGNGVAPHVIIDEGDPLDFILFGKQE